MTYNTFIVSECKTGKVLLVTSSARKATQLLHIGTRIDVWNNNAHYTRVTAKNIRTMNVFIRIEKDYIRQKQERAEEKNKKSFSHLTEKMKVV